MSSLMKRSAGAKILPLEPDIWSVDTLEIMAPGLEYLAVEEWNSACTVPADYSRRACDVARAIVSGSMSVFMRDL